MDSLIAKADAIGPAGKKRKLRHTSSSSGPSTDRTFQSISKRTSIPKSLQSSGAIPEGAHSYKHIANKKLRTELSRQSARAVEAKALIEDAGLLLTGEAGRMEVEGEMDRTWRVGQDEIVQGAGQEGARGRREWKLEGGPYRLRYTRNGRYVCRIIHPGAYFSCFSGIWLLLETQVMSLRLTGKPVPFILSCSYKKHVVI